MPKPLIEIKVLVETDSDEAERLTGVIEKAICGHPMEAHPERCPYRWFIMTTHLAPEDAASWEDLLNE